MKTIKQVIEERPGYRILINAVIKRVGKNSIPDINSYGIAGGYNGFIYYVDTYNFAMRYRKYIIKLLEELSREFCEEIIKMVSNFQYFHRNPMDNDDRKDLYRYLGDGKPKGQIITNLLAWLAAEEVCRWFEEY